MNIENDQIFQTVLMKLTYTRISEIVIIPKGV